VALELQTVLVVLAEVEVALLHIVEQKILVAVDQEMVALLEQVTADLVL